MKTKRYPHVTGLYGDSGENPGALAIHAVLDPSPNYPESGRIIVGSPATTPTLPGYIPNLGGFNGGPAAIERLAWTLLEATRDARAAMGEQPAVAPTLDLDDLERKARAATAGPWRVGSSDPADYRAVLREDAEGDVYEIVNDAAPEDAAHIAAASPPVMIALIARIRELDAAADRAVMISDEAFGLGPVVPIEETLGRIERGIFGQGQRIRELEAALRDAVDHIDDLHLADPGLRAEAVRLREVLAKGVVLP